VISRILPDEEYERLGFIFSPKNLPIPDPMVERVAVVEDCGNIVAIGMTRILPMLDGLWVEPKYRGGVVNYREAVKPLEEMFFPGSRCYSLGLGKFTQRILREIGYDEVPGHLYEKRF